jgi:hypothetical protein
MKFRAQHFPLRALQVAQAPKASNPRVQAISELELDQAWMPTQAPRSTDINLSLLTSCLLPSAQVSDRRPAV